MSVSYWLDQTSPGKVFKEVDVAIIGGGISGVSAAYWLKKEDPSLNVTILEKNRLGFGATGRNAGFITCGSVEHFNRLIQKHGEKEALEIWKFSERNLELLQEEIIEDASELNFEKKGSFSLAATESEFKELLDVAQWMERLDIRVETLQEKEIQERLGANDFVGGIKYVDDASVHPIKLTQKVLEKSAIEMQEQVEVAGFNSDSGGVRIQTDRGDVLASLVVLAGNGYLPLMHPFFKEKVFPTRGQILVTEPVDRFMEGPCYANFVLDYFRQIPTGQMLIGGFRQLEKETEVGYSDHTTEVIQNSLYDFIQKHLPKLKDKKITHSWAGVMGFSADGNPIVGALPSDPQVFFLGGYTAHGLGLAFHSGKCLVDVMFGRPIPDFISAKRF